MVYFLKVVMYIPILWIIYTLAKRDWNNYNAGLINKRIRIKTIYISAVVIGIYSLSYNGTFWWGDLSYYSRLFNNGLPIPESPGLNLIYTVLHIFTRNTDILLFIVSTLACLIMLFSYRLYEEAEPSSILYLLLSAFFIEACQVNLKQGIACGFASLFFVMITKRRFVIAIIIAIAASLFHVTAGPILLISFIVAISVNINNRLIKLGVILLVLSSLFYFDTVISLVGKLGFFIPGLSEKLLEYTSESGIFESDTTSLIIFKGFPYYIISIVGLFDRKYYKDEIQHYDVFLAISLLASVSYAMSGISYWMSRVIDYYWMTDFVFLGLLLSKMKTNNRLIIKYGVAAIMFLFTFRQLIQMYL